MFRPSAATAAVSAEAFTTLWKLSLMTRCLSGWTMKVPLWEMLMNEAEVLVLAAPIYYFTLCAQIQAPVQRMYCVNKPAKVQKMALLMSSYSPNVYDGATAEFRDICNYWQVENMGFVSAKIDEQKTEETKQKVVALVGKL